MNFELTAGQQEWARRAREFSQAVVAGLAASIDEHGVVPAEVWDGLAAQSITNPFPDGAITASVVVEEISAASAGVATALGLDWAGYSVADEPSQLPGLRGSTAGAGLSSGDYAARARLVLCSVALGVGRAANAESVEVMKARGIRASGDEPTPHWTLADAATEVDAARLLTLSAAQAVERGEPADEALSMAGRLCTAAAERSVEAACLIEGPSGYRRGSVLERLTRDARTLKLLLSR